MKVIRRNLDKNGCGVVGAFNALSWCNKPKKYEDILKIAKEKFGYSPKGGMSGYNFSRLIKHFKVPAKDAVGLSVEDIQSKVYMGKAFVLLYTSADAKMGHITFIMADKNGKIKVINEQPGVGWDDIASDIAAGGSIGAAWELPNRKML